MLTNNRTIDNTNMKRLFLQLILTLIVGICSAQSEHMKFKGVPMEGTLQSFTNK